MKKVVPVLALLALGAFSASAQAQSHRPVCPGPAAHGSARCNAQVIVDRLGKPQRTTTPSGFGPADLQSAYNIAPGAGGTIAIVDAYDDPTAEGDLGVYRKQYGLTACTTANGCFKKINQRGGSTAPAVNASWAQEISLDLDMASAICPGCKILLVESDNNSFTNLAAAVTTAGATPGVSAISNSYGGPEFNGETTYEAPYNQTAAVTVSSGDSGYGVEFPAASRYVTAVGGTSLKKAAGTARGWTETAWSGAGSGCSAYIPKPSYQPAVDTCTNRMVADVSAVADPNTGVAVYDSTPYQGRSGWMKFGGTSAAAPIVASAYALRSDSLRASDLYSGASLFDVTSGSNGSCGGSVLCSSATGWDGPTGMGTPNGPSAF